MNMRSTFAILFILLCLGLFSCNILGNKLPDLEPTTTPEIFNPLPADQRAFEAVRELLAGQLGLDPLEIDLVDVTPVDWPDSCLGSSSAGEVCSQVVTSGFRVRLRDADAIYEFHTDQDACIIRQVK
jgi:hypothetical protein